MKLNSYQNNVVNTFLSYINEPDLLSLSRTVTNNLLPIKTASDAIEAILLHEIDMRSLLSRRKVTREVLFKYLHDLKIDIPSNSEKSFLISKVFEIWNQDVKEVSLPSSHPSIERHAEVTVSPNVENIGDVNKLAEKFVTWFYNMINDYVLNQDNELSVEHFWSDCSFHLVMESTSENVVENVYKNANGVVNLLKEVLHQHRLFFNPNISQSGIRGKVDAHGLVVVAACGTLHQVHNCVGIFRQVFGLLRDPFMENNWRIKSSSILLKSVETSSMPSIDCEHSNLKLPE